MEKSIIDFSKRPESILDYYNCNKDDGYFNLPAHSIPILHFVQQVGLKIVLGS